MRDRMFLISGLLGIGAIAMTAFLSLLGPTTTGPLPPGFTTPIIAFEFAASESEVWQLFQPPGSAAAMDRVNRWDFVFMTLYGLFLATFALACARQTGQRRYRLAAVLALAIVAADALENVQLLGLTYATTLDGGSLVGLLARLRLYTWLKWGGLALYFLLFIPYFRGLGGRLLWISAAAVVPAALALVAYFNRGLPNELLALSTGLMFFLFTLSAFIQSDFRKEEGGRMREEKLGFGN